MRKSLLLVVFIVACSNVGVGQFILGRSDYWGKAVGIHPHGIYHRPVYWQFLLLEYRWSRLSIISEIAPFQISEVEYDNKVDRTVFSMIGLGVRSPLHTISNTDKNIRLVFDLSIVYKKIWDDVFYEHYSLGLQSGSRLGTTYKILLEYDTKQFVIINLGVSYYNDWFAFGMRDRTNAQLWRYSGVYFSLNVDMSNFVKALKERYRSEE